MGKKQSEHCRTFKDKVTQLTKTPKQRPNKDINEKKSTISIVTNGFVIIKRKKD